MQLAGADDKRILSQIISASSGEVILTLLGDCANSTPRVLTAAPHTLAKLNQLNHAEN